MKHYRVVREFIATLVDTSYPQKLRALYDVVETDDGVLVYNLVHGTLEILSEKEGHA
jgi:hypothetical protein